MASPAQFLRRRGFSLNENLTPGMLCFPHAWGAHGVLRELEERGSRYVNCFPRSQDQSAKTASPSPCAGPLYLSHRHHAAQCDHSGRRPPDPPHHLYRRYLRHCHLLPGTRLAGDRRLHDRDQHNGHAGQFHHYDRGLPGGHLDRRRYCPRHDLLRSQAFLAQRVPGPAPCHLRHHRGIHRQRLDHSGHHGRRRHGHRRWFGYPARHRRRSSGHRRLLRRQALPPLRQHQSGRRGGGHQAV